MTHPIDVKAAAWAALLAGQRVGDVAQRLGLPKQTVSRWKRQATRRGPHKVYVNQNPDNF